MRKTLIAATALAVLTTSAQAQLDHVGTLVGPSSPACVTTLHLDEAEALINARRPVNKDFCLMLKGGTEVVRVQSFGEYRQIAYQVGGKTFMLFMDRLAMADELEERRMYGIKVRQEAEERSKKQMARIEEGKRMQADIDVLENKHHRCVMASELGLYHPICTGLAKAIEDKRIDDH